MTSKMPWFSSRKNLLADDSDPKLISATAISPDENFSSVENDEKNDEKVAKKKKFGTWGNKLRRKRQNQKKRSKSIGPPDPESINSLEEITGIEKLIIDKFEEAKIKSADALGISFRPTNISQEAPKAISPEVVQDLSKAEDSPPSSDKTKIDKSPQPREKTPSHPVTLSTRAKSFSEFQSHDNPAITSTDHKAPLKKQTLNRRKTLALSRADCCADKVCLDESGYISDGIQTERIISPSESNAEFLSEIKTKFSTYTEHQDESKLEKSLLDLDRLSPTSSKALRRNTWDVSFYRTQSEPDTWPKKEPAPSNQRQPASIKNSNTPPQEQAINRPLKFDEKSFSTMTINYPQSPKLTGMKKFQITRKTNLTELTLTQLADSLFMDLIRVCLKKGEGKKLGFSIVQNIGSKNCSPGIFIKGIMPDGQAAEEGTLRSGDMILAVNGELIDSLMTRCQVTQKIRSVKPGKIIFHVGRKHSSLV